MASLVWLPSRLIDRYSQVCSYFLEENPNTVLLDAKMPIDAKMLIGFFLWAGVWSYWFRHHPKDCKSHEQYRHKLVLVLGLDLMVLTPFQLHGSRAFVIVIVMCVVNSLLAVFLWKDKQWVDNKHTACSIYEDPAAGYLQIWTIFAGQVIFFIFVMKHIFNSGGGLTPNYGFWVSGYMVQMSAFFGLAQNSQLGPTWNIQKWKKIVTGPQPNIFESPKDQKIRFEMSRKGAICRCILGFVVNTIFRDIVAHATPLLLLQAGSPAECVGGALGITFIVTLDDFEDLKTFGFPRKKKRNRWYVDAKKNA
mmetsp:Transcript_64089/g.139417  ORF Transcript_64089/g.139417 Transcript_64089/m.139417 type:complete len:307 (+) Transcript_64089:67-987(+)